MDREIEDRVFALSWELNDASKVIDAVVEEYGIDRGAAWRFYAKVRSQRGTPNSVALREAIDRLGRIRFI